MFAFADHVLFGLHSPQDLNSLAQRNEPGQHAVLPWHEGALKSPIARAIGMNGEVLDVKLPKTTFTDFFRTLIDAVGYVGVRESVHAVEGTRGRNSMASALYPSSNIWATLHW